MSTPHSTACRAAAAVPTVCNTVAPAAFARGTSAAGWRQKNEMTRTPSSRAASSRSSCGNSKFRLPTPNGLDVRARVSRICWRTVARSARQAPAAKRTSITYCGRKGRPHGASHGSLNDRLLYSQKILQRVVSWRARCYATKLKSPAAHPTMSIYGFPLLARSRHKTASAVRSLWGGKRTTNARYEHFRF